MIILTFTKLFSFTFGTKGGYQEKIAKKVAKKLKIENKFYEIPSDFITNYAEEIIFKGDGLINIRASNFISLLKDIRSTDYLLLTGDPAIINIAGAIVSEITNGKYNLLKWDKQDRVYYPVQINLHEKGNTDERNQL